MFDVLESILEIIRLVRPIEDQVKRRDPDLARQIRRATNGVLLNASEANQRTGGDRLYLFRSSRGSASELTDGLRAAVAWGYLADEQIAAIEPKLDRVRAILWRLAHPKA